MESRKREFNKSTIKLSVTMMFMKPPIFQCPRALMSLQGFYSNRLPRWKTLNGKILKNDYLKRLEGGLFERIWYSNGNWKKFEYFFGNLPTQYEDQVFLSQSRKAFLKICLMIFLNSLKDFVDFLMVWRGQKDNVRFKIFFFRDFWRKVFKIDSSENS